MSSTIIICEESQSSNGLLRFLGFDTFSIQVFGFGFIVMSFICYNFFTNAQRPSGKVDSEPRKKGSGECNVNELSVKVENQFH